MNVIVLTKVVSGARMTKSITKSLLHLLKDFKSTNYATEIDFIEKCIIDGRFSSEDAIIEYFLKLTQCEEFVNKIAKDFIKCRKLNNVTEDYIKILIFFLIFIMDSKNAKELVEDPVYYFIPLLNFLCLDEKHPIIARWATQYFDNDFVVHNILGPLLGRVEAFKAIIRYIEQEEQKKFLPAPTTVMKPFKLSKGVVKQPTPVNSPEVKMMDGALPKRRMLTFAAIQSKIQKEHTKHEIEAGLLLEKIKDVKSYGFARPTLKSVSGVEETSFKSKKAPPKKEVEIKRNIATTLREASLLLKEQEEEISKIENIVKGGFSSRNIEEAVAEQRKKNQEDAWKEIQKKHLQGLITFEESIIAKKKLLEENRQKFLDIKAERNDLHEKLHQFKEQEQEKVKAQVERTQKMKQEGKETEKKFFEKKIEEARVKEYELKEVLKKHEQEKAEELLKQMELIQEIKNLHEINVKMNEAKKDFDPTECPNLGLLGEMSIAELYERLAVEKMKMKQELDAKRKQIQSKKRQQQNMIESYKEFVNQTRKGPRSVIVENDYTPKYQENKELQELKRQLEEKRSLRIKISS